ncbi:MAG TPA: amidase [Gaiellales bacterium]|nr:amidase [Gaiellales bacterium]
MEDLYRLSARDALDLFASRALSPVELMEAVIRRAEQVEPEINAFPHTYYDEALEAAREAEARYAGRGPRPRPLEGIPVAIKDETAIRGQPLTQASLIHKDDVADHTSLVAERILRAGGIVHARAATPEFSAAPFTHSRLYGITRNPWNPAYSPGGSSGGGAAALAAGSATLANGSDIGGSIRIPATFCGVVGFKPPYGRVPVEAPYNLDHYCHDGPLARTVSDCAVLQNVIAGPHPADPVALRPKLRIPGELRGVDGWRIGYTPDLGYDVDPEVRAGVLEAVEALRAAGATVEEVAVGWTHGDVEAAARAHFGALFGGSVDEERRAYRDLMSAYTVKFGEESGDVTMADYVRGLSVEAEIHAALSRIHRRYRALVGPGFGVAKLRAGDDCLDVDVYDFLLTVVFNICSRNPVVSVPSGRTADGVPTGVQIAGRPYDDVSVFRAARALERVRPWPLIAEPAAVRA